MRLILIFLLFIVSSYSKEILKAGYLVDKELLISKNVYLVANVISKQLNKIDENIHVELIQYTDLNKIMKDYKDKKLQAVALSTHNYFEKKKTLNELSRKKWAINYTQNKYEQYYLIKNKNYKFNFKDIKKSIIYLKDSSYPSKIWFDYLLLKKLKNNMYRDLNISVVRKEYKLITRVFFRENTIAIINKDIYDYVKELNPQVKSNIEIIAKSDPIFTSIILLAHKSINEDNFVKFENIFNKFSEIFKGTGYDTLSRVEHIKVDDNYLDKYDKFYSEYLKLKKRYK